MPGRRKAAAKQQTEAAAELVRLPMPRPARGPDLRRRIKQLPGYDPYRDAKGYTFDLEKARKAVGFFQDELVHVKGAMAGQPFRLEPWQQGYIANLFGWVDAAGLRRFRESLLFVPRKNGKTTLAAGVILYMLFCDGEAGAEVYGAASEYQQASLVFAHCRGMIARNPSLAARCQVYAGQAKAVQLKDDLSTYRVISSDALSAHGFSTSCAVIDELHTQPDSELVDAIQTSTGARQQPLILHLTTSDYERESVCNSKHKYASDVRAGLIKDPRFLPAIFEAKIADDWTRAATWRAANPNYGRSVSAEYLRRECQRAIDQPSYENQFKRLHLNIRTEQSERFLQMAKWDACPSEIDAGQLLGRPCYGGLDLSSTTDLTALVLHFQLDDDGGSAWLPFCWVPADSATQRERRDGVPYMAWQKQGRVEMTPGNSVDYAYVRRKINKLAELYDIRAIAFDAWNATHIAQELTEDGVEMMKFRQGWVSMNEPLKRFESLVLGEQLNHGGCPVLRWNASNLAVKRDESNNIRPDKKKSTEKIDVIVAGIMALGLCMTMQREAGTVYATEEREAGLVTI